jgi:hypothetical protein
VGLSIMDKYYIPINTNLASSMMVACQILGWGFETQLHQSLESILIAWNDEIHEEQEGQRKQE